MDEISRGIATAALALQSALLQALVHKGVLAPGDAIDIAEKAVAGAGERIGEDEEKVAEVAVTCLDSVREGLATMVV